MLQRQIRGAMLLRCKLYVASICKTKKTSFKNGKLTPFDVTYGRGKNVWWQCSRDSSHEWEANCVSQKVSCPFCTNLKALYPEIAKEWHIMRNYPLKSTEAHIEMKKKVWWQCGSNTKHIWQATVRARVRDRRCPECLKN